MTSNIMYKDNYTQPYFVHMVQNNGRAVETFPRLFIWISHSKTTTNSSLNIDNYVKKIELFK